MSLGKALGGGVPVGAALVSEEVARHDRVRRSRHAPTAATCSPAARRCAVLDELVGGGLLAHVGRGRPTLRAAAAARWPPSTPIVKEVRGAGLMWGLELTRDAAPVVPAGLERGVIVNRTAETVVRLLPPLVITEAEADEALARLDAALGAVGAEE